MKCKCCGNKIDFHYGKGLENKLKLLRICFTCDFWIEKFETLNSINVARINNNHYTIGREQDDGGFRGHAGRKFIIKFDDGEVIKTTNLWHQGEIPERFRKYLPNNATFVKEV